MLTADMMMVTMVTMVPCINNASHCTSTTLHLIPGLPVRNTHSFDTHVAGTIVFTQQSFLANRARVFDSQRSHDLSDPAARHSTKPWNDTSGAGGHQVNAESLSHLVNVPKM